MIIAGRRALCFVVIEMDGYGRMDGGQSPPPLSLRKDLSHVWRVVLKCFFIWIYFISLLHYGEQMTKNVIVMVV